jgi:putative thioredoxin
MDMPSNIIVNVTELDFEYEVLNYSQNTPVVVDFWATWCKPCKTLDPILEKLALEANGTFRLAKVDVDSNPNLVLRYGIRTIPTVKAITQGEVVAEFVDMQPETRIREFVSKIFPPNPINLAVEKADSLLDQFAWQDAEKLYREILETNTDLPAALFGLSKALLGQGEARQALMILNEFPASKFYTRAKQLLPLAMAIAEYKAEILPEDSDLDAYFVSNIRLAARGNLFAAIDGLLDILREDKNYRDDLGREVLLSLLELLGESNPSTRNYRSELASILY